MLIPLLRFASVIKVLKILAIFYLNVLVTRLRANLETRVIEILQRKKLSYLGNHYRIIPIRDQSPNLISAKQLKQVEEVIVEPLMQIWNKEIIESKKFPSELKCADITPIFKKNGL